MSNLIDILPNTNSDVQSPGNSNELRHLGSAQLQPYRSPGHHNDNITPSFIRRSADPPSTEPSINTTLTTEQFQHLLLNITESIKTTHSSSAPKDENPFAIARAEFYISQGLTFQFDGSPGKLAPWIRKFKALRSNALWREATYFKHDNKTYDILTDFTKIKEAMIKPLAQQRASSDNQSKSLKPENAEFFYARILGKVVISSITDEFYTKLQNYAGDEFAGDGPYLLWLILTHFHMSTITYQAQVKQQIRTRSLTNDHDEDVEAYLLWIRQHLDLLLTTSGTVPSAHVDLMEPIFDQLLTTKSTRLRRLVEDKHLAYYGEVESFTPVTLVEGLEKQCRALRQSNQLYTSTDADIIALMSAHKATLAATPITRTLTGTGPHAGHATRSTTKAVKPHWFDKPPKDPTQTHQFENRTWNWCPACGPSGKWVCTHTATTHSDNYMKKRKGTQPHRERRPSPSPPPTAHNATTFDSAELARLVAAQLSTQLQAHMASAPPTSFLPPPPVFPPPAEDPCMGAEEW
jgi:hypothetical protein